LGARSRGWREWSPRERRASRARLETAVILIRHMSQPARAGTRALFPGDEIPDPPKV